VTDVAGFACEVLVILRHYTIQTFESFIRVFNYQCKKASFVSYTCIFRRMI
jgi:hypothetical protein